MGVLIDGDVMIGTGCYDGNHITGVYVLPDYQKQGCGSKIMDCLEMEISKNRIQFFWMLRFRQCVYMNIGGIKQ